MFNNFNIRLILIILTLTIFSNKFFAQDEYCEYNKQKEIANCQGFMPCDTICGECGTTRNVFFELNDIQRLRKVNCSISRTTRMSIDKTTENKLLNKQFDKLTFAEKQEIVRSFGNNTNDEQKLPFLLTIACKNDDTTYQTRLLRTTCIDKLVLYNTKIVTDSLLKILLGSNIYHAYEAAFTLIKLGVTKEPQDFFVTHVNDCIFASDSYIEALLLLNNSTTEVVLKKISNKWNDPNFAIDASVALALIGNYDYAFYQLQKYCHHKNANTRIMAIKCLAYYIGDERVFNLIKQISKNEKNIEVLQVANYINSLFENIK